MTTRAKPQNYDIVRNGILQNCTEPKTLAELAQLLGVDKNVAYRAANHLIAGKCVKLVNDKSKKAQAYLTVSFDFKHPPTKSNYKPKEVYTPSAGGRVFTLDTPFKRDEDCLQTRHLATDRLRREERKSSRTYVGISTVYNG